MDVVYLSTPEAAGDIRTCSPSTFNPTMLQTCFRNSANTAVANGGQLLVRFPFHESMATGLPIGGHHHHGAPIIRPGQVKVDSVVENAPNKHLCIFKVVQSCLKLSKIAIVRLSRKTSLALGMIWRFSVFLLKFWPSDDLSLFAEDSRNNLRQWLATNADKLARPSE